MIRYRPTQYFLGCLLVGYFTQVSSQCTMTSPCVEQLGQGAMFQKPIQIRSYTRSWGMSLTVDIGTIHYGWLELKRRLYNGQATGPTITVKRGDTLSVTLTNNLSEEGNHRGVKMNGHHHPNSTNLHTHGLHISPMEPQDSVFINVGPKSSYQYVYQIHSESPPGTYWYHAHLHGSTLFHVSSGLSGILIVEDNPSEMPEELAAVSCPDNCEFDIQLLFQPHLMFSGQRGFGALQDTISDYVGFHHDGYNVTGGGTLTDWLAANVDYYTTNGQLQPKMSMITGQMYRFRMINAGGERTLELYITDKNGNVTSNCDIREIALDGVYLSEPRKMHAGQTLLVPGAKADWLVKCTVPGTYKLVSFPDVANFISIGFMLRYAGDLLTLEVSGADMSSSFPGELPNNPSFLNDLRNVPEDKIGGRFVVELDPMDNLNRELWSGKTNYRYKMKVGAIQEWHLLNTDGRRPHPLHIHVNHFQVISYNNYTGGIGNKIGNEWYLTDVNNLTERCFYQHNNYSVGDQTPESDVPVQGPFGVENATLQFWGHEARFAANTGGTLGYSRVGDWRDVVLVPPLANITIRFVPHEFTGDVIIHCHILDHEDHGMMMVVEIVNEGENTKANIRPGNALPGTCRECDRYPFNNSSRLCDTNDVLTQKTTTGRDKNLKGKMTFILSLMRKYLRRRLGYATGN